MQLVNSRIVFWCVELHLCLIFCTKKYIITQKKRGEKMGMALKIRTILLERNMSIKELSDKLGYKGTNLYNKLRRDNLTEKELRDIADILNCDYDGIFTYRDTGKKV